MNKLSSQSVLRFVKEYVFMAIGMLIYSFAWVGIVLPAKSMGGGASGLALLLYYMTGGDGGGIPVGVGVFVINSALLLMAGFIVGWNFGIKTIYCIVILSLSMSFMQGLLPDNLLGLADDKLLSTILGGVLAGVGISLCFAQGGSTGGTDIVAMIINKYKTISYGRIILACDGLIIFSSYFIFHDMAPCVYGCIMSASFGFTVDMIVAGNKQSSQLFIISQTPEKIAEHIVSDLHRGVTMLNGEGWYSKQPLKIVMVLCRKNETSFLLRMIRECDPAAFVTVGSVMGVYGKGFEQLKK